MLLGELFKSINKNYQKICVEGISFDSKKVKKKDVFFAIKGNKTSGNKFINDAISNGASAIVVGKNFDRKKYNVPLLYVKDVRKSLSEACSSFYKKKPSNIIAVTGTNGKSSVVNFFYQILNLSKISVASIGTLGIFSKSYNKKTNLTSPDPLLLHKTLQILAIKKIKNVILEASSHGLDQKRLNSLDIKIGIFTNLSHDHLDYHKNIKSYLNSKMYLFKNLLNKNSKIITDEENKEFKTIKNIAKQRKIKKNTIGLNSGRVRILFNKYYEDRQIVKVSVNKKKFLLEIPLIGFFQVKNLLMAILAAENCGLNINKIFNLMHKIKPISGRLERVANLNNESKIIIDFAHTPDALEQCLIALKKQFQKEIVIVFGCGGERDKQKRLKMGKIAKKYCKKIFVTDDNPRNENPKKIRNAILKGCKDIAEDIGDRKKAIKTAVKQLSPNEILLIAGKGHETTQDYGSKVINFSDKQIVKNIFKKIKISKILTKKALHIKKLANLNYRKVSINSKNIKKNDLFFAVKGKRKNGHHFVKEALNKGALKIIVSQKSNKIPSNKIIKVKNTISALNSLARFTRNNTGAEIIGITGSVGKTTLKNLVSFALTNYGKTHHSPYSYNNKYGVPLSICNIKNDTEYGIFEIGMDKKGEIYNLSKIVKPKIGVITNISEAHIKNFKTLKDIAKAKSEIIYNISKDGNIVLNKDDKFFSFLSKQAKKEGIKVVSFSSRKKADVYLSEIKKIKSHYRLKILVNKKIYYFNTLNYSDSFISNILACISVLNALNLNLNKLKEKFINFSTPDGRGDIKMVKKFNRVFKFIDESYNANPLSMCSAIRNISSYQRKDSSKKLIFLGDMLELGNRSKKLHKKLSSEINKSDIDKVYVYGKHIKETFNGLSINKKGKIFNNLKEAYNHFKKIIHNNDLLMIKGSNATGLNQFSKNIKKEYISAL